MTPAQFQAAFTSYAEQAAAGTGLLPGLFLAQWAVETAYASSFAGTFNLGNITRGGSQFGFVNYGSYTQAVDAEILLLHDAPYAGVLAAAGADLGQQCIALGASPWDAGHYDNGGGPGSSLIATLPVFGMNINTTEDDMTDAQAAQLTQVAAQLDTLYKFLANPADPRWVALLDGKTYAAPDSGGTEPAEPTTVTLDVPAQTITVPPQTITGKLT